MPLSVELLDAQHFSQAGRLWQICFSAPYDIFASQQYIEKQLGQLFGAFEDGELISTCGVINFSAQLGGRTIGCAGICAVATHPSFRRRGLTNLLMSRALSEAHGRGDAIAALWPFSYPFYERFGFQVTDRQYKVTAQLANLHKRPIGDAAQYREAAAPCVLYNSAAEAEPALELLAELHHRWCQLHSLSLSRDRHRWLRIFGRPGSSWLVLTHRQGYMIIDWSSSTETLQLREWCYLTAEAFADGLAWLAHMDSQFQSACWTAASIDEIYRFNLHSLVKVEVLPGMMSRVLHSGELQKTLELSFDDKLQIADPLSLSGNVTGAGPAIGPGELMQELVAFHVSARSGMESLYGRGGKAFSVEKF
jgi:predicted acetyltransferase